MLLDKTQASQFLKGLPFFTGLPDADLTALLQAASLRDYHKQQHIFEQGDAADRFFIVMLGWIKLYRNTTDGDEAIISLFTRGDVFGEAAIFDGTSYPFAAEAAEAAKLIEISGAVLRDRAKSNPDIMARIMNSMSTEMRHLQMENEHLALMNAPQRVGCLLLQLAANMESAGGIFSFPYDKALAATKMGMKPETFSRALIQLQPIGVTVKGTEVKIESFAALADYCCNHCSALPGECKGSCAKSCASTQCSGK